MKSSNFSHPNKLNFIHILFFVFIFYIPQIYTQAPCPVPDIGCAGCITTINVSSLPVYDNRSQGDNFKGDIIASCECMDQSVPAHHCHKFRFIMDAKFPNLQVHVGQGSGCEGNLDGAYAIRSNGSCTVLAHHTGAGTIINFQDDDKYIDIFLCVNSHASVSLCNVTKSSIPLAINLISLNIYPLQYSNIITWSTDREVNNNYFIIEKSIDGKTWINIGKVAGAGNSNVLNRYSFIDDNPENMSYYRLKQVDYNENFSLSEVVKINREKSEMINLFPNPVDSKLHFTVNQPFLNAISVRITNLSGYECFSKTFASDDIFTIDIKDFPDGAYFINILGDGFSYAKKFIKVKEYY